MTKKNNIVKKLSSTTISNIISGYTKDTVDIKLTIMQADFVSTLLKVCRDEMAEKQMLNDQDKQLLKTITDTFDAAIERWLGSREKGTRT